jgi:hypothetical protein
MAKAKILVAVKASARQYMVVSNLKIFRDLWGGMHFEDVALIPARDELQAWQIGNEIANEYNKRVKE